MTALPDWMECSRKIDAGEAMSSLEMFVYHNEPAGEDEAADFRKQLSDVVAELSKGVSEQ